jgi:polar amino acid transport system permease protein
MNSFQVLWHYREAFYGGFLVTMQLLLYTSFIGTAIGGAVEILCGYIGSPIRRLVDAIAFCISAIPALVILFWIYYPSQELFRISVSPFGTALIALSILNTFAVYRIIADALRDFPKQFVATGLVCGLSRSQIICHIQLPLLLRAALPRWIDQQVLILQTSLFASLISVEETFRVAQRVNSVIYQPVIIYTSMAILFLGTAGVAMYLAQHLRSRYYRDFSER